MREEVPLQAPEASHLDNKVLAAKGLDQKEAGEGVQPRQGEEAQAHQEEEAKQEEKPVQQRRRRRRRRCSQRRVKDATGGEPVQPEEEEKPVQPEEAKKEEQPVQPEEEKPAQPEEEKPVQPEEEKPVQPEAPFRRLCGFQKPVLWLSKASLWPSEELAKAKPANDNDDDSADKPEPKLPAKANPAHKVFEATAAQRTALLRKAAELEAAARACNNEVRYSLSSSLSCDCSVTRVVVMAPEQPKKPVGGAYGVFSNDKRAEFQKACAGQQGSAVSKMAGAEWKKLTDAQKAPYQKRYEDNKAKFDKDMAAFLAAGGEKQKGARALRSEKAKEKEGGGKKKKDANAPKKPAGGAYGQYLAENRAAIVKTLPAGHKITDVAKAAGAKWKALSDKDKKPYEDKYQKKMGEYKVAIEEYKKNNGGAEVEEEEEEEEEAAPKKKANK